MIIDLTTDDDAFLFMVSTYPDFLKDLDSGKNAWSGIVESSLVTTWLVEVTESSLGAYEYRGKFYFHFYYCNRNRHSQDEFDALAKTKMGWYSVSHVNTVVDNPEKVFEVELFTPALSSLVTFKVKE